jgi:hypothetical protein
MWLQYSAKSIGDNQIIREGEPTPEKDKSNRNWYNLEGGGEM